MVVKVAWVLAWVHGDPTLHPTNRMLINFIEVVSVFWRIYYLICLVNFRDQLMHVCISISMKIGSEIESLAIMGAIKR